MLIFHLFSAHLSLPIYINYLDSCFLFVEKDVNSSPFFRSLVVLYINYLDSHLLVVVEVILQPLRPLVIIYPWTSALCYWETKHYSSDTEQRRQREPRNDCLSRAVIGYWDVLTTHDS